MIYDILPSENLEYSDIRDTLVAGGGSVNNDVASAFQEAANINKWSKHKPIRYAKDTALTEAEMKGNSSDKAKGIYYGLKAATVATFNDLHNTQYQYIGRPTGGRNEPYRLSDFRGYAKNAKPTLVGFIPAWIYFNAAKSLVVQIDYDYNHTNTTGVDINDFLPDNTLIDIGDYYPCILIDKYAKVLYNLNLSTTDNKYTTLRHNNQWYNRFFADVENCPELQREGVVKASIFLMREIYTVGIQDFRNWADVTDIIQPFEGIGVPDATGNDLEMKEYISYIPIKFTKIFPVNRTNFRVNFTFVDDKPTKTTTYTCVITSPGQGTKELVYPEQLVLTGFTFNWKTDIGFVLQPGTQQIKISGRIDGSDGSRVYFEETVTVPA